MKLLQLSAAFSAGWLLAIMGQTVSVKAQTSPAEKPATTPRKTHRVDFAGRVAFIGMTKREFVSLFGKSDCSEKQRRWGDCMEITHQMLTDSGAPIKNPDGTPFLELDGEVAFDNLGRIKTIERDWPPPNNINEFWATLFNLMSGGAAESGSSVSIKAIPHDSDGSALLIFSFRDGKVLSSGYRSGLKAGSDTDLTLIEIEEFFM
jgi:hypothetical protein